MFRRSWLSPQQNAWKARYGDCVACAEQITWTRQSASTIHSPFDFKESLLGSLRALERILGDVDYIL